MSLKVPRYPAVITRGEMLQRSIEELVPTVHI